ncbi:MAG: ABC transporter ATP-binding protein [Anaerolineales bacterium]|nr:ABC transporter ATP-binding protein [Anaerolineales bacterium]NUQ83303.1 ABC transporter ATP-binding protein [Anaerolineales bacterium]
MPIIEVNDLRRTFGENVAVDRMTFTVEPGEVFGLLGPNGAGKTTTVRLLNGILPPSEGTARVFGFDPTTQGEDIRRKTGVLTETPALYERLSARENLEFFATLQAIPESDVSRRVDEMLEFFELAPRAKDKVETFSKGMKQRLALARALIHKPPLLFLDEPTSGLDPEAAQQVNDLIANLTSANGQTVVLATHNLFEAQRLCDRVAVMNKGKILALGSLKELARKLWPVTWVDITFHVKPKGKVADALKIHRGVIQASAEDEALAVQVENEDVIPEVVRHLVNNGASILRVNPRDYTLEDIYFALQAGEA